MKKPTKRILIAVGLAVWAAVAYIGFHMWRTVTQIPEAYAAWDAATLVIEHLDTHGGAWPRSWEELFAAATAFADAGGGEGAQKLALGVGAGRREREVEAKRRADETGGAHAVHAVGRLIEKADQMVMGLAHSLETVLKFSKKSSDANLAARATTFHAALKAKLPNLFE